MNISILLPYKENFVSNKAGAVSLFVNDITKNSSKFLENAKKRNNNLDLGIKKISLRFHQDFIVNYTYDLIKYKKKNKFIWGAVPRSGKTFMIGGLIEKYEPENVIIFLISKIKK